MIGVHFVTGWSGDRSDTFVLVRAELAPRSWHALADVIVQPAERTLPAAHAAAVATRCRLPGCALVAVGVLRQGALLCCRDGRVLVLPGDGSVIETLYLARLVYLSLVCR